MSLQAGGGAGVRLLDDDGYDHADATVAGVDDEGFATSSNALGTGAVVASVTGSLFGAVLFLRLAWVTGQSGLWVTLGFFAVAYSAVIFTTLSLGALASAGRVRGGGAYFLISRALGPETGAAIGTALFLGTCASGAVYFLALAEGLTTAFSLSDAHWSQWAYASAALVAFGLLTVVGAELYAKTTTFILVGIFASVSVAAASFAFQDPDKVADKNPYFTGPSSSTFSGNLGSHFSDSPTTVFGVFFSCVTGIMAGVNISGDLKHPARSIPRGTLMGLGISFAIYGPLVFLIASSVRHEGLADPDYGFPAMHDISFVPQLISVGVLLACASSGMASTLGAGKILQAIARDDLLPGLGVFKRGFGKGDEPRLAVLFSMFLMFAIMTAVADLNSAANAASAAFLISYCLCNIASLLTGSQHQRRSWRWQSWHTALGGALTTFGLAMWTQPILTTATIAFLASVAYAVHHRTPGAVWGDVRQSLQYHRARALLLSLDSEVHIKYWRPQVLLLVANPRGSYRMIELANCMKKAGLLLAGHVVAREDGASPAAARELEERRAAWLGYIKHRGTKAFAATTLARSVREGARQLAMASGVGAMRPNTVMVGLHERGVAPREALRDMGLGAAEEAALAAALAPFPPLRAADEPPLGVRDYVGLLRDATALGKNTVVACNAAQLDRSLVDGSRPAGGAPAPGQGKRYIDVWALPLSDWGRRGAVADLLVPDAASEDTQGFALLLAHLLKRSRGGRFPRDTELRLLTLVPTDRDAPEAEERLEQLLRVARVSVATTKVVTLRGGLGRDFSASSLASDVSTDSVRDTRRSMGDGATRLRAVSHRAAERDLPVDVGPLAADAGPYETVAHAMRSVQRHTAITLCPMPAPPAGEADDDEYLAALETLSAGAGPTLLCHATRAVMTETI